MDDAECVRGFERLAGLDTELRYLAPGQAAATRQAFSERLSLQLFHRVVGAPVGGDAKVMHLHQVVVV